MNNTRIQPPISSHLLEGLIESIQKGDSIRVQNIMKQIDEVCPYDKLQNDFNAIKGHFLSYVSYVGLNVVST